MNEYSYRELHAAVEENRNDTAAINALGEWFEMYGSRFWNGETYNADTFRLRPVYKQIDEDDFELVGYEID